MSIKIMLVDDHEIVRAGLRLLIQAQGDMEIVGEAENGQQAIELCHKASPDVVVMDITLPGPSGLEVTRQIKQQYPDINVLALTIHEGEQYFFEMLNAGASGYVPKRAAPTDLVAAIRAVYSGEVYLHPSVAKTLVNDYIQRVQMGWERASYDGLTEREQQVLKMIAEGLMNKEIAERLSISVRTVERHRENIMSKLNLHTRAELVRYAVDKGLIDLGSKPVAE
jgi:two-component system, NarL family, response regulator NreC